MNSKQGTFINGVRLRAMTMAVLFPGMQVHVGNPKEKNSFMVHFLKEKWKERRSSSLPMLKRPSKEKTMQMTKCPSDEGCPPKYPLQVPLLRVAKA
jgi:hypothetical protein